MKVTSTNLGATALALTAFCFSMQADAVPVLCKEASAKDGPMDASELRSCLAADVTGITEEIFSVDAGRNELSIAVAPVGSHQLDHWFVDFLNPMLASGDWNFVKVIDRDGRLSHIKLYGRPPSSTIPEPGTLALLGLGLVAAGIARRRKRS